MKIRVVKESSKQYYLQRKDSFFSKWADLGEDIEDRWGDKVGFKTTYYKSEEKATNEMIEELIILENQKTEKESLGVKITLSYKELKEKYPEKFV